MSELQLQGDEEAFKVVVGVVFVCGVSGSRRPKRKANNKGCQASALNKPRHAPCGSRRGGGEDYCPGTYMYTSSAEYRMPAI